MLLGAFLVAPTPLRAQPRLALVHGDDGEGSPTGAGAFAWPGNGTGTFSTAAPIATTGLTGLVTTTVFNAGG